MDVLRPKGPVLFGGSGMLEWARSQLLLAGQILDNPGGGLLFATQSMGQVKAALNESEPGRWEAVVHLLGRAEAAAVNREQDRARALLEEARTALAGDGARS